MNSLDLEWEIFQNSINNNNINLYSKNVSKIHQLQSEMPKCSDIYISTQTKIAFLNTSIKLYDIFWKLPVLDYFNPQEGIIKKSIKISCNNIEEVDKLENIIKNTKNVEQMIISKINNPHARVNKFKDVRKIDIGLNKKDLTCYKKKTKGAFYNCFAIILRILYKNEYKEVHVKIFNTGKLEIPGIQFDDLLIITLDKLISILKPLTIENINYNENKISTVLINSNFNCGFYLNRFKLYEILKTKYNINSAYDPCSYPGIQSKFYYNENNKINNGIKTNEFEEWLEISFMIFRTGSVLIVGNCNKNILNIIYLFLKDVLKNEYENIFIKLNDTKKKKSVKKIRKKKILFTIK